MFSLITGGGSGESQAATAQDAGASPPKFSTYLLPSFTAPFRRRRQSPPTSYGSPPDDAAVPDLSMSPTDSAVSSPRDSPPAPSFLALQATLTKDSPRASVDPPSPTRLTRTQPDTIRCSTCASDFAFCSQIVSKGFTGRYGRAYLVAPPVHPLKGHKAGELVNVKVGKSENRLLVTGSHVVADIACVVCGTKVGWKYVDAKEESQKYKVGKYILETRRTVDYRSWENVAVSEMPKLDDGYKEYAGKREDGDAVEFDSGDEDECEDIFAGTWDPVVAARRRDRKLSKRSKQSSA